MNLKRRLVLLSSMLFSSLLIVSSISCCRPKSGEPIEKESPQIILKVDGEKVSQAEIVIGKEPLRIEASLSKGSIESPLIWTVSQENIVKISETGDNKEVIFVKGLQEGQIDLTCTTKINGKDVKAVLSIAITDNPNAEYFTFDVDDNPGTEYSIGISASSGEATIYHGDGLVESFKVSEDAEKNTPTFVKFRVNKDKKIKVKAAGLFQIALEGVPVTNFDASHSPLMYYLYIIGGKLTNVDVSNMKMLKECFMEENQIVSFKTGSDHEQLYYIQLDDNFLTDGKFEIAPEVQAILRVLTLSRNKFNSFDLSPYVKLDEFKMSQNNLTSINASGLRLLGKLYVANNNITSMDITGCKYLSNLRVHGNKLTSLGCDMTEEGIEYFQNIRLENNQFSKEYLESLMALLHNYDYHNSDGTINKYDKSVADATHFSAWGNPGVPSEEAYKKLEEKYWNVERTNSATNQTTSYSIPRNHVYEKGITNDRD